MVYKFFDSKVASPDKKSEGSGAKHVNTKTTPQNEQLAEELHKPITIKGLNFIMHILKNGCEAIILLCIQHIMKENLLLLKDLLER